MDTGQSLNGSLLFVTGSVDGVPVDLKGHGVLPYCSNQANHFCTLECTVGFDTIHSPSYYIGGACFSAGGNGTDLQQIGVDASHKDPRYTIRFLCGAISDYTCYLNGTVFTRVGLQPGESHQL